MKLKLIGAVYGFFGLTSLLTFWIFLRYGPAIEMVESGDLQYHFVILGICVITALVGVLIFYSFWFLKSWGRYLAIGVNIVWVGGFVFAFLVGRLTDGEQSFVTGPVVVFIAGFVLLPLIVTKYLFRSDVAELMAQGDKEEK